MVNLEKSRRNRHEFKVFDSKFQNEKTKNGLQCFEFENRNQWIFEKLKRRNTKLL